MCRASCYHTTSALVCKLIAAIDVKSLAVDLCSCSIVHPSFPSCLVSGRIQVGRARGARPPSSAKAFVKQDG